MVVQHDYHVPKWLAFFYESKQIDGSRPQEDFAKPTGLEGSRQPMSPRAVYRLRLGGGKEFPSCRNSDGIKCSFTYEFEWLWEEECEATFVCSKLVGELLN